MPVEPPPLTPSGSVGLAYGNLLVTAMAELGVCLCWDSQLGGGIHLLKSFDDIALLRSSIQGWHLNYKSPMSLVQMRQSCGGAEPSIQLAGR